MAVISNQCVACGQWRGRGHVCPTSTPAQREAARKAEADQMIAELQAIAPGRRDSNGDVLARVDRARDYILSLQSDKRLHAAVTGAAYTHAQYDYSDLTLITAMSRDCDLNPDTPWREGEREQFATMFANANSHDPYDYPINGTHYEAEDAGRRILAHADNDPVLRDRLRIAYAAALSPNGNPPAYPVSGAVLISELHDAAKKDPQYTEARDWAVAYESGRSSGYLSHDAQARIFDVFHETHERTEHTNPRVHEALWSCYFGPNASS